MRLLWIAFDMDVLLRTEAEVHKVIIRIVRKPLIDELLFSPETGGRRELLVTLAMSFYGGYPPFNFSSVQPACMHTLAFTQKPLRFIIIHLF